MAKSVMAKESVSVVAVAVSMDRTATDIPVPSARSVRSVFLSSVLALAHVVPSFAFSIFSIADMSDEVH